MYRYEQCGVNKVFGEPTVFEAILGDELWPPPYFGRGAWGCYRSHLSIYEYHLHQHTEAVCIFEDDCVFCPDFASKVEKYITALPKDWKQAYLGGQHLKQHILKPRPVNDYVSIPFNVNRTHAYMISRKGMLELYQWLESNRGLTFDNLHNKHIDHYMGQWHQTDPGGVYCPAAGFWYCGQDQGKSWISGRVQSKQHTWCSQWKEDKIQLPEHLEHKQDANKS